MSSLGRGRPPKYAAQIHAITQEEGWVPICEQANRTAPSGFRQRYPGYEFRSVPIPGTNRHMLQARVDESHVSGREDER